MGVNGIYGLSGSGIDVESMVKVGMMSRQSEYNKLQQQYTKDEWQKEAYTQIYGNIQTFNNSTLTQYKLQSTMNAKNASTTSSAVTVSANGAAPVLNHKIQVNSLSSTAYLISTNSLKRYNSEENTTNGLDSSINLADVLFQGLQKNTGSGTTKAMVHEIDGDDDSGTLYDLTATAFSLQVSDGTMNAAGTDYKYSTIKYTYGDLLDGRTFNDLVSDINSLNIGVRANYDSTNDTLSFYNKEGGSDNGVYFRIPTKTETDDDGETITTITTAGERAKNFLQGLHLYQSLDGELKGFDGADKTSTNYFGYESTYATASISASKALTYADGTSDGSVAFTNMEIGDILFRDIEKYTTEVETGEVDENGEPYIDTVERIRYNDLSSPTTDSEDESTAITYQYDQEYSADDVALSFSIGEEEFNYTYGQLLAFSNNEGYGSGFTVQNLIDDINNTYGINIASVDENGILSFTADEAGADNSFSITTNNDLTTRFFNSLGFTDAITGNSVTFTEGNAQAVNGTDESSSTQFGTAGTSGSVTIDGVEYNNITDNKITAAGVTYTLLETTDEAVTVNVTQDTESIIDKVKSFIEDYNKLLSGLYEKYDEKQYSDYKPLTESQKEQMTEEQIEKWEEKAKSGMLYHDQTLSKVIYNIRDAISSPVESLSGKYDSIFSIGVKTTGLKGQLTLDEDKLKAALADDPDSVYNVFGTIGKNDTFDENGVAQRLGDVFSDNMKIIKSRAGTDSSINDDSDLGTLMRNLQTRMSDFKKLMDSFENKLYKKYDAMEVSLSRLGMQLSFITGGQ